MKKLLFITVILFAMVASSLSAFAGDIPESLLMNDNAQIFFGEVIEYNPDKNEPDITVSPVKKIKGDIKIGTQQIYLKPNPMGEAKIKVGNVYLFIYYDEVNTTDIFEVTSYDTKKLKIKGVSGDMWERFEEYINIGEYEKAEAKRCMVPFTKLLDITRDKAENVYIMYRENKYEINVNDFFDIAEKITLTDVEDEPLDSKALSKGIYININNETKYAFITLDGYVDKYSLFMSRLPCGDLKIKHDDFKKICSLLPIDVPISDAVDTDNGGDRQLPSHKNRISKERLQILFVFLILPFLAGVLIRLLFIKWKKAYMLSGIFIIVSIIMWLRAELINTHGSEGPALIAMMVTMFTIGSLLVGLLSHLIKKKKIKTGGA